MTALEQFLCLSAAALCCTEESSGLGSTWLPSWLQLNHLLIMEIKPLSYSQHTEYGVQSFTKNDNNGAVTVRPGCSVGVDVGCWLGNRSVVPCVCLCV